MEKDPKKEVKLTAVPISWNNGYDYSFVANNPLFVVDNILHLRSSEKLYRWLIGHKLFGAYIYSYLHFRAVRRRARNLALLLLWSTLTLTVILISNTAVTRILTGVGSAVSIHLLKLKTVTSKMLEEVRQGLKKPRDDRQTAMHE
ncbi:MULTISPECIES: DUF454 family protein [unclassified Mesotoga]|nr:MULTISPECIES: DUF454 family protein [unclassified Mesotoga]